MPKIPPYTHLPSRHIRQLCRLYLVESAARHQIPPAHIVAHIRTAPAVRARREVMLYMLSLGLTRSQLALAFGRDLRRVRASVIGKVPSEEVPSAKEGRNSKFQTRNSKGEATYKASRVDRAFVFLGTWNLEFGTSPIGSLGTSGSAPPRAGPSPAAAGAAFA